MLWTTGIGQWPVPCERVLAVETSRVCWLAIERNRVAETFTPHSK